jgi:hypothetical protein
MRGKHIDEHTLRSDVEGSELDDTNLSKYATHRGAEGTALAESRTSRASGLNPSAFLENSETRGTADTAANATRTEQIEARNPSRIIISKTVWALGYVGKTVHLDHIGRF